MAERIDLDVYSEKDIGLSSDFNNWLSTLVDILNENLSLIEQKFIDAGLDFHLTRVDTSSTSNIELSDSMKDFLDKITDQLRSIESRLKALEK